MLGKKLTVRTLELYACTEVWSEKLAIMPLGSLE